MVYYIRFLKPPKLCIHKDVVKALVTVTTDLGDEFYPGPLILHAIAVTAGWSKDWQSSWQTTKWKSGMRTVWIEVPGIVESPPELLQLVVNTQPSWMANNAILDDIPKVLGARSNILGRGGDWENHQARDRIERRYKTTGGQERTVYEDTGESIARHIWDAGFTLAIFLSHVIANPRRKSVIAKILRQSTAHSPKVIELGSGCGIVGLELAHICPTSDILLTDLPEAMDVLKFNVNKAKFPSKRGKVATAIVNWNRNLPPEITSNHFDMIVASDCTYNCDSIPAFVNTLVALTSHSPAALVVVSMKTRHDSERIFFDLMGGGGLLQIDRISIPLPDAVRQERGESLEVVDIYMYRRA